MRFPCIFGRFIREKLTNETFSRMKHPFWDASPCIDAIFEGRFIRACQPETILLLARVTNETVGETRIVWGVRGADSTRGTPPKVDKNYIFFRTSLHVFFRILLLVDEWNVPKNVTKNCIFADSDMHFVRITVTLDEWTSAEAFWPFTVFSAPGVFGVTHTSFWPPNAVFFD